LPKNWNKEPFKIFLEIGFEIWKKKYSAIKVHSKAELISFFLHVVKQKKRKKLLTKLPCTHIIIVPVIYAEHRININKILVIVLKHHLTKTELHSAIVAFMLPRRRQMLEKGNQGIKVVSWELLFVLLYPRTKNGWWRCRPCHSKFFRYAFQARIFSKLNSKNMLSIASALTNETNTFPYSICEKYLIFYIRKKYQLITTKTKN
jgi:hypothetical protein